MLIKLEDVVDLPTEPDHPQRIQQLAVQCKAQRCYESQSRQLKNEGEKNLPRFARKIAATCLYTLPSPVAVPLKKCFLRACLWLNIGQQIYCTTLPSTLWKHMNCNVFVCLFSVFNSSTRKCFPWLMQKSTSVTFGNTLIPWPKRTFQDLRM